VPRSDGAVFHPEMREFGVPAERPHPGRLAMGGLRTAPHLQSCPTVSFQARP